MLLAKSADAAVADPGTESVAAGVPFASDVIFTSEESADGSDDGAAEDCVAGADAGDVTAVAALSVVVVVEDAGVVGAAAAAANRPDAFNTPDRRAAMAMKKI